MPTGRLIEGLDRVAVDDFTRLTQWDQVFQRDMVVLTHDDWPVDWVWEQYGAARSHVAVLVDGVEVGRATGRSDLLYGRACCRALGAFARAEADVRKHLVGVVALAMGGPPTFTARRTRSTEIHQTLREAAEFAARLDADHWAANARGLVVPIIGSSAEPLGAVAAALPDVGLLTSVNIWVPADADDEDWRIARADLVQPLQTAGWAALATETAGTGPAAADIVALEALEAHLEETT